MKQLHRFSNYQVEYFIIQPSIIPNIKVDQKAQKFDRKIKFEFKN